MNSGPATYEIFELALVPKFSVLVSFVCKIDEVIIFTHRVTVSMDHLSPYRQCLEQ